MDDRVGPARSLAHATIARRRRPETDRAARTARASIDAATDGPMNAVDRALGLLERAMLPITVLGLVAGLALTWAGETEMAGVVWTIPAIVVAVRLALGDPARPRARRVRRRPHRDPGDRRCAPARRAVRRQRHRRDAGDRPGAGALFARSRSARIDGPPGTGAARRPAISGWTTRDDPDRGRRSRRPAGYPARRSRTRRWPGRRELPPFSTSPR